MLRNKRTWLIAGLVAGLLLLWYGLGLAMWRDTQVLYYNAGLQAYRTGDVPHAVQFFDQSVALYKRFPESNLHAAFDLPRAFGRGSSAGRLPEG